jgi:uncharacterized membrane protein YecN with MAPEG domain
MRLQIIPYYAAALGLLYVLLAVRVIRARNEHRVALGTGGVAALERRIRVHGNFAEYVPFALLLLAFAELRGVAPLLLNGLAICLVLGRLLHAWGVSDPAENTRLRVAGMVLTFAALAGAALTILALPMLA